MVGVVGSSPIVPTRFHKCRARQHGIFFRYPRTIPVVFCVQGAIVTADEYGVCSASGVRAVAMQRYGALPFFRFWRAFFMLLC